MINIKEFKNKKAPDTENNNYQVKAFIEKMFEARQVAHNFHLKTKSYSQHKALEKFYSELLNHVDDFVETYQGQHGLIENIEIKVSKKGDVVFFLEEFCNITKTFRNNLKENHLQNILDEIVSLTYKTIYKLKYLK
jgi:hypothetical protein